ncbi:MAG: hypothetical protein IM568_06800 [Flavobacterium sp.]|nr:hypothetical protein [Flavobacterium sp.]
MKFKIGDVVSLIDNNSEKYVITKSRFENLTEDSLIALTAKTNILGLKEKISSIELGNFDYLLIQSIPNPFPKEIEIPNYKLVLLDELQ